MVNFYKKIIFSVLLAGIIITGCNTVDNISPKVDLMGRENDQIVHNEEIRAPIDDINTDSINYNEQFNIWFDESLPISLLNNISINDKYKIVKNKSDADVYLAPGSGGDTQIEWIYLLLAPFPTLLDDVDSQDIMNVWKGNKTSIESYLPLLLTKNTYNLFNQIWGESDEANINIIDKDDLLEYAWGNNNLAIIPFEDLSPQWKVIKIDGVSALDGAQTSDDCFLKTNISFKYQSDLVRDETHDLLEDLYLPVTNLEYEKLSSVLMTGVTALVRSTALKMEENGMTYPAEKIIDWLISADITHISNEVSFDPNCPPANPYQDSLQFCSRPEYMDLLKYIDVDVIELTGNHLMDWNRNAFEYSINMYEKMGWRYYAGGINLQTAEKPLLIEHNSNKFAFLGCNPVGPDHVWATDTSPGNVKCDYEEMEILIKDLSEQGYIPIFTIQYYESYTSIPNPDQIRVFNRMSEAGAVIVNGSQAHYPQTMEFNGENFIHYGLGNLFFDQMDLPVPGTRREFLDKHYFYAGKYISTELYTAMLEDYAQPRPMSKDERNIFLSDIFELSSWE